MLAQERKGLYSSTVIFNKTFGGEFALMRVYCPEVATEALPGQFANLKVEGEKEPYLRRPLTFYRTQPEEGWLEFIYKLKGKGTISLSRAQMGDKISILGPLGKGYSLEKKGPLLLVGRGIGLASLVFLAEWQARQGIPVYTIASFSREDAIYGQDLLEKCCKDFRILTDTTGQSNPENVQSILANWVSKEHFSLACTCGSTRLAMLMKEYLHPFSIPIELSLEERMGCGIGSCLVCTCDIKPGGQFKRVRVCCDGPVFALEEVIWNEES